MTRHDADEVLGRITRSGTLDRRYRIRYPKPEPVKVGWRDVASILWQAAVLLACFGAILLVGAIAMTAYPVPVR